MMGRAERNNPYPSSIGTARRLSTRRATCAGVAIVPPCQPLSLFGRPATWKRKITRICPQAARRRNSHTVATPSTVATSR